MKQELEYISTRKVAARIRTGKLPEGSDGGEPRCACHPDTPHPEGATTYALKFWSKGDKIGCTVNRKTWAPALAFFPALGIVIDTRL